MSTSIDAAREQATLVIRRRFDADIETLFRALTDPAALSDWFGPVGVEVLHAESDLRVGGRWAIAMADVSREEHNVSGEYVEVDPPRKVVFTWAWRSMPDRVSQVTYALNPVRDGGTTLTLTHERLASAEVRDRHAAGWNGSFDKLDRLLAGEGGDR